MPDYRRLYADARTNGGLKLALRSKPQIVEKLMPLSMRMTKSFATILLLAAGCSSLDSASASLPGHCEYFDNSATSETEPELSYLLKELPTGSAIRVCQSPKYVDGITVFSPIGHRDGVSYFVSLSFRKRDSSNATTTELVELTMGTPYLQTTMMAFDGGADINHISEEFVEAEFISIGMFKLLYTKWSSIIAAPTKHYDAINYSSLDSESKGVYGTFIESLSGNDRWKIRTLGFPAGDVEEFSPRFEIEISGNTRAWSIDFDLLDATTIKLLSISEMAG
jgi:hypothetical protein